MLGKHLKNKAVVSCEHGVYAVPKFLISKSGKVNFIARKVIDYLGKQKEKRFIQTSLPVSFMPGMNCNLCCNYCYQRNSAESPLSKPHFKRIDNYPTPLIDYICKQAAKLNLNQVTVNLLGGEPLLYTDKILQFLEELQIQIKIKSIGLITNGTLLDASTLETLISFGLDHIQFTFDGGVQAHDAVRHYPTGKGSHQQVLNALQLALEHNVRCSARINLSSQNVNSCYDTLDALASLSNQQNLKVYFALVDDTKFYTDTQLTTALTKCQEPIRYACKKQLQVVLPSHNGSCSTCKDYKNPRGIVLTADGYLYSCWDSAGQDGAIVGDCKNGLYLTRKNNWSRCGEHTRVTL